MEQKSSSSSSKATAWTIWIIGWLITLGAYLGSPTVSAYAAENSFWDTVGYSLMSAIILFPTWPLALGCSLSSILSV